MQRFVAALALALFVLAGCSGDRGAPWQNSRLPIERRVEDRLRRMTPEQKREMAAGRNGIHQAETPAGYPPDLAMAATWNTDLVGLEGRAIAHELLARGDDQLLAPQPEGYGEDPWLASRMTVAYVGAVQVEGVIATPKFFPAQRGQDERTLRELRLPPFRAAVEEAGAWSLLASGDDAGLLTGVLKKDWGFKGFVVPDPQNDPDDSARRILSAMFATGYFDRQRKVNGVDMADRDLVVRAAAIQSPILLKNAGGLLPLDPSRVHSMAVIGTHELPGIRERAGTMIQVRSVSGDNLKSAADVARQSDVAIVSVDGSGQDQLIQSVASANPRTVVVLTAGPVGGAGKWISRVPALLSAWLPVGVAPVLFGDVSPSGKLPVSYPTGDLVTPSEGIYAGYRYFDKKNIEPLFPFGYGLSYTTFSYSDLKIFPATPRYGQIVQVVVNIRNTGTRAGAEVVQVYVHQMKPSLDRPVRELKAFRRVELKAGEMKTVPIELDRRSMWFFDPAVHDWATEPGVYEVLVGASSRDIRLRGSFELFE